jgi:hypothetical protein
MPPSRQYLFPLGKKRQTSAWLPPKGEDRGPLAVLPCKSAVSWGSGMGAMMLFMDPSVAPLGGDLGSRRR